MALPLSQSITLTPLGIIALCGAIAILFYVTGRLWSGKGERAQQEDGCLQAGTNKRFADSHKHRIRRQDRSLIHVRLTKRKDEPPRYAMAADLIGDDIDGDALFEGLVVMRAAMKELNETMGT